MVTYSAGLTERLDQAGHLGSGEAADLDQIIPDQAFVGLAQALIAELTQGLLDPLIGFIPGGNFEIQGGSALEEGPDLFQGQEPLGV